MVAGAGVPEWPKGSGLGPDGLVLRGFESHPPHHCLVPPPWLLGGLFGVVFGVCWLFGGVFWLFLCLFCY